MILRFSWLMPILALGFISAGCGQSGRPAVTKFPVSGTVTLDGKPMAAGKVIFKNDLLSSVDHAVVTDGKMSGEAAPGRARVEISVIRQYKDSKVMAGQEVTLEEETIAPEFNSKSTLAATVTEAGPNEFSFAAKSKK